MQHVSNQNEVISLKLQAIKMISFSVKYSFGLDWDQNNNKKNSRLKKFVFLSPPPSPKYYDTRLTAVSHFWVTTLLRWAQDGNMSTPRAFVHPCYYLTIKCKSNFVKNSHRHFTIFEDWKNNAVTKMLSKINWKLNLHIVHSKSLFFSLILEENISLSSFFLILSRSSICFSLMLDMFPQW